MEFLGVLFAVFFGLGALGALVSRRPARVLWYERSLQERALLPEAVGEGGYRGPLFQAPVEVSFPVVTNVLALPMAMRRAASGCRVAFVGGVLTILPILVGIVFELESGGPQAAVVLGVTGLALSFGQLAARRALLNPKPGSARRVFGIGVWTLLHNACVVGAVVLASCGQLSGTWGMFDVHGMGTLSLLIVAFSTALGVYLLQAAKALDAEPGLAR